MTRLQQPRPLLLWGFMGSGKSTVGPLVARRGGARFDDLDACVEAAAGKTIPTIFEEDGEAAFRRHERACLRAWLDDTANRQAVLALGGGALVDSQTRQLARERGFVVTLTAPPDTLLARTADSTRPLLAGPDAPKRLQALLAARASAYADVHATISTDGATPDEVAERVLRAWRRSARR